MEALYDPDYYPVSRLQPQLVQLKALVEKCHTQLAGNSVVLMGHRSLGPMAIVKEALKDVSCPIVWLNGQLLSDSNSILQSLSWSFNTNFTAYEQFGAYLEQEHAQTPIVFVVEDIDEFARIPGQNLLYTLFEAPSNQRLPVLVIGLTEKFDFVSLLEKRVKSRFSQHCISATEQPITTQSYFECLEEAFQTLELKKTFLATLKRVMNTVAVKTCLNQHFLYTPVLHNVLGKLAPLLTTQPAKLTAKEVTCLLAAGNCELKESIQNASLPVLLLLVALFRLAAKTNGASKINFEACLKEYEEMRRQGDQNDIHQSFKISRERLHLAWNSLIEQGFLQKNAHSWVEGEKDLVSVAQPLTNLHDCLPAGCPEFLRHLAILD